MGKIYTHFSEYTGQWPWKNFTKKEISCKHCGEMYLDASSMDALQRLRTSTGRPIVITSGHRCKEHNKRVGGAVNSQHLKIAFDCVCPTRDQASFIKAAKGAGFTGIGRYPSRNFVHLDMGPKREWAG